MREDELLGPESFGGSDEESHYMSQTRIRMMDERCNVRECYLHRGHSGEHKNRSELNGPELTKWEREERAREADERLNAASATHQSIEAAKEAVRILIRIMSDDPGRPGLERTPERVVNSLLEMADVETFDFTTFDSEEMSEMIVQSNIPMHSLCEHHMLPFMGTAAIAYIPKGKIVGLSKLARAVKFCAAGLQNQERITTHIADLLEQNLEPAGVGVVIRARHLCMELRGVSVPGTLTTTSCMRGAFTDAATRAEFLALAGVTK